jgi:hypothetical protein
MIRSPTLLFLLAACNGGTDVIEHDGPVEQYAFVTTLGKDTVAVENVSRSAGALISDGVDRWPFVRLRHTELEIAPDGRLTRMVMDVRTPSGKTPAEQWRRVNAQFADDSVRITVTDSAGVKGRNFATGGELTVPHASMQYSVIEFEIASAIRRAGAGGGVGDTLIFRQFYPDRDVGPRFVLHSGRVMPQGSGRVVLRHDWLSGAGEVTIDSAGRMLSYSGQPSTYKVRVARMADHLDVTPIAASLVAAEQRAGANQLSVRDTARGTIGTTTLEVDYSRPLARGRTLLGNVISYGRVWRTGANEATQFTISAPITLAGLDVPAGTYTLWTLPREDGVDLIVNRQVGQWGTSFDQAQNLGTVPMRSETVTPAVEKFTISVVPRDARSGDLVLEWGTFRWTAPIVVP